MQTETVQLNQTKSQEDIHSKFDRVYGREDDLTQSMMLRAIGDLHITDADALDIVYETVSFQTADFPESEGWGSSDARICVNSVRDSLILNGFLSAEVAHD
jgi:hypothetical protein